MSFFGTSFLHNALNYFKTGICPSNLTILRLWSTSYKEGFVFPKMKPNKTDLQSSCSINGHKGTDLDTYLAANMCHRFRRISAKADISKRMFLDGKTKPESVTPCADAFRENDAARQKGSGCSVSKNPLIYKKLLLRANRTRLGPLLANC